MEDDGRVISPVAGLDEFMTEEKISSHLVKAEMSFAKD